MTTHEIIEAEEVPAGVRLKIQWREPAHVTTGFYSTQHAKALGWKRPDPHPVDPAWMVEVAREGCQQRIRELGGSIDYTTGAYDSAETMRVAVYTLRLALSRGHVVLAPVMPSEEEMLAGAREDAAQANERRFPEFAGFVRAGDKDGSFEVKAALQARRNVYASLGAVAGKAVSSGPGVSEVNLREAFRAAWHLGYTSARAVLGRVMEGAEINSAHYDEVREKDVSAILENLKTGEA